MKTFRHLTRAERADIAARYPTEYTQHLAAEYGVSIRTIQYTAKKAGVTRPPEVTKKHQLVGQRAFFERLRRRLRFGLPIDGLTKRRLLTISPEKRKVVREIKRYHGYEYDEHDDLTLYYTDTTRRSLKEQELTTTYGIRFLPMPEPPQEDTDEDYEED